MLRVKVPQKDFNLTQVYKPKRILCKFAPISRMTLELVKKTEISQKTEDLDL